MNRNYSEYKNTDTAQIIVKMVIMETYIYSNIQYRYSRKPKGQTLYVEEKNVKNIKSAI